MISSKVNVLYFYCELQEETEELSKCWSKESQNEILRLGGTYLEIRPSGRLRQEDYRSEPSLLAT